LTGRFARAGARSDTTTIRLKFHLAGLMTKLGARNRVELAIWAYETSRVR
jgi:DNA-binding NarL/FixJ family response regulator